MEYKELKWSNPIAEEIYQAEANRKFLKSCLNELSIVFEPAFVLAAGALGGFIRTSFTFPEVSSWNLNVSYMYIYSRFKTLAQLALNCTNMYTHIQVGLFQ